MLREVPYWSEILSRSLACAKRVLAFLTSTRRGVSSSGCCGRKRDYRVIRWSVVRHGAPPCCTVANCTVVDVPDLLEVDHAVMAHGLL